MMDTDILFRDGRTFASNFNNMTSLMNDDMVGSSGSDGVDTNNFASGICNWNYNSGFTSDFELMLDRLDFDPVSGSHYNTVGMEWDNTIEQEVGNSLESKPSLYELEAVKKEPIEIIDVVKKEPNTSIIDTHYDAQQTKTDIPGFDEIASVPLFFEYSEFPEMNITNKFAVNDLPPNLDLCAFINDDGNASEIEKKENCQPKFKAGRKRIDLKAQRYIVGDEDEEEENVDVETISEGGNNPVLEAGDLDSLLEQFEATEVEVREESINDSGIEEKPVLIKEEHLSNPSKLTSSMLNNSNDRDTKETEQNEIHVKGAFLDASARVVDPKDQIIEHEPVYVTSNDQAANNKGKPPVVAAQPDNKQIIEALPQELIDRIKTSGKRKRIAIIDPVPNNGGKKRKMQESAHPTTTNYNISANLLSIELDHNYCTLVTSSNKRNPKKDSGYLSTEEEDKSLHNQPVVKNADGKLMISLLKVNTIRSINNENKKKKLNIEEYKKRRLGVLSTPSSRSNSPMSSNCSSPLPEDDNTKRLKHEEKLRRMALELLSTPPKSTGVSTTIKPVVNEKILIPVKTIPAPPTDMQVITYVSMGVNTDISGRHPLAPAEQLEEIKPLLENASVKISSNSLINSLIENIPKVIKAEPLMKSENTGEEHGVDKTIIYLPKNRKRPECLNAGVQTSITLVGDNKRRYRRRRNSSTSSCSSSSSGVHSSNRSRRSQGTKYSKSKSSRSSRSTSISSSSSRSSTRTRPRSYSKSPSPQRRRRRGHDQEYVQEAEERRVVYVGKIAPKTSKEDLYRRFARFGPIKTISLHFRDHGDNYGFVTFANKLDAYEAIEHGNDDPYDMQYDLSFGGRRLFCKTNYSDLDNVREDSGYCPSTPAAKPSPGESFDILLREMQEKLRRRKV